MRAEHLGRAEDVGAAQAYLDAAYREASAYHYDGALELIGQGLAVKSNARMEPGLYCASGDIQHNPGLIADARAAHEEALALAIEEKDHCRARIGLAAANRVTDGPASHKPQRCLAEPCRFAR
ncbi:hypothetical protein [Mesorhizobium sp. M0208]|uniref:hypothetical protein n=1 Tax=Mesorhizobium sp. M0208 TaxID=2956916 RepID=UPI003339D09A